MHTPPCSLQGPSDLKVKSHPVVLDRNSLSSATSAADSTAWDLDDELPPSRSMTSQRAHSGSPWAQSSSNAFRDSVDDTAFNFAPLDNSGSGSQQPRSRFAPGAGSSNAGLGSSGGGPVGGSPRASGVTGRPEEGSRQAERAEESNALVSVPSDPVVRRRLTWAVIVLEAVLLVGVVAAFLALQLLKSRHNKCTWQYLALYGAQVGADGRAAVIRPVPMHACHFMHPTGHTRRDASGALCHTPHSWKQLRHHIKAAQS